MPATVIAERVGWQHSMTILKERVRELRPLFVGVDPTDRVVYEPGQVAQCDLWFPPADPCRRRSGTDPAGVGDDVRLLADHGWRDDPSRQGGDIYWPA